MRHGTIVEAALIAEPSSTKNKTGQRNPEIGQMKQGEQWHHRYTKGFTYGMIHSVLGTPENVHDLMPAAPPLHGDEEVVYADADYQSIANTRQ